MGQKDDAATDRWLGRPWLSRAVRFVVCAAPFACSVLSALALTNLIPLAHNWPAAVIRLIVIAAGATIVLFGADRVIRRMLPLAALLSLTLVFPDEAPSRFKIALRSGGTAELKRRLDEYRRIGANEPSLAAQRLLELVADLSRHDRLTRGHSERVRAYSQMIAAELGLSDLEIDSLRWAALLHDIGKLETPFEILNKPGRLTDEEVETIRRHPGAGAKLAAPLAGWLGQSIRAVGEHHERWDGNGYPNGLRGIDISLAARIVAVADTFDVMTSVRSYQKPVSAAEAREELARCAGTQFDANVVRAFLSISIGKLRLAMGPLSWITQLAFFPVGIVGASAAPALMVVAGLTAATVGSAVGPSTEDTRPTRPSTASIVEGLSSETDQPTVTVTAATEVSSQTMESAETNPRSETLPSNPTDSTVFTLEQPTTTTTGSRTSTTVSGAVDQTVPVSLFPTSIPAPTTGVAVPRPPSASIPTSTSPDTRASPNTSAPSTTPPTAVSTTSTPSPAPSTRTYLLGSSAAGDVESRAVLPLVDRAPLNTGALPNLDTDRDDRPGRLLKKDSLLALGDPDAIQRFRLDPPGSIRLSGPIRLLLFAAAKNFVDNRVQTQAAIVDCIDGVTLCNVFAAATVTFTGADNQYTALTFDFGAQTRTLPAAHHLEVWIVVTTGSERAAAETSAPG